MANSLAQIVKVAVGGVVVAGSVAAGALTANKYEKIATGEIRTSSSEVVESSVEEVPVEKFNPITDEMRAKAEACEYDFDPASVIIKQQEEYDFNDEELKKMTYSSTREDHELVYVFEGEYSEGYQGQYNTYLSGMYLWDDGMFIGKSNSQTFRGYWYNQSLTAPEDDPETEDVNESIDCLNMVSDDEFTISDQGQTRTEKFFQSIITQEPMGGTADFYERQAYIFMYPGWGMGRSVVVSGYKYYPNVAAFIDTNGYNKMNVGEKFIVNSTWFFDRVIQNLSYTPIIPTSEIKWTLPDGMIDDKKKLTAPGEYEITAKWKDYEATATLTVVA